MIDDWMDSLVFAVRDNKRLFETVFGAEAMEDISFSTRRGATVKGRFSFQLYNDEKLVITLKVSLNAYSDIKAEHASLGIDKTMSVKEIGWLGDKVAGHTLHAIQCDMVSKMMRKILEGDY